MCEEFLTAPTHLHNYTDLLVEQELIGRVIDDPTYDDISGLMNAYHYARDSTHTTQVGAYISTTKSGVGGYNRHDIGGHAESWAVATAARLGIRTQDQTMYAPWASCVDCALDIVAAGIRRVVVHSVMMDLTPHRWQHSIQRGLYLLRDRGVQVDMVSRPLGGLKVWFDGKEVEV